MTHTERLQLVCARLARDSIERTHEQVEEVAKVLLVSLWHGKDVSEQDVKNFFCVVFFSEPVYKRLHDECKREKA